MEIVQTGLEKLGIVTVFVAGLWAAWSLAEIGMGFKEHNGAGMNSGLKGLAGAVLVAAAGGLLMHLNIPK